MCAAIGMDYHPEYDILIQSYIADETRKRFAEKNEIIFAYWDPIPILPVRNGNTITFFQWGNREKRAGLPKTGWARSESLRNAKWDYLNPVVVRIPAQRGCEKKTWFTIHSDIRGVLVRKENIARVYMITEEATIPYKTMTGHDRMPRFHDGARAFSA